MKTSIHRPRLQSTVQGFSIVELLIAMVLGLLVVGSALAIFLSNRQTYTATEGVGRTSENARLAFELMARDLRESGSTPCGNSRLTVSTVLNGAGTNWYDWQTAMTGYDGGVVMPGVAFGTTLRERIAGTDAVELHSGTAGGAKINQHNKWNVASDGEFTMVNASHGYTAGEIVVVCDYQRGAVFQISSVAGDKIRYNTAGVTPGNANTKLGGCLETECTSDFYQFQNTALITRLGASRWFIGANGRTCNGVPCRSLYQQSVQSGVTSVAEEIAENVQDLQVTYLLNTNAQYYQDRKVTPAASYVNAVLPTEWDRVLAIRLTMQLAGPERINGNDIARTLTHTVTVRNQTL